MATFASVVQREQPMAGDQEIDPLAEHAAVPVLEQTSLKLSPEQKVKLLQRALNRIDELMQEQGIDHGGGCQTAGWAWKRQKNQMQYDNDFAYRLGDGKNLTIFDYSNFSPNISKRYARLMSAKTNDDLVGTDPFFSSMPTEHGDPPLARESEGYVQDQISQSNAKQRIASAQKTALIRNEAVVKLSYVTNETYFVGGSVVAVGPFEYIGPDGKKVQVATGDPVMTPKGDYIYEEDDTFPDPSVQGLVRLEKEPGVSFQYAPTYGYIPDLRQKLNAGAEGLDLRVLDYRDFLCPLTAATIHEADINVHLFDEHWARLNAQYRGFAVSSDYLQQGYMSGEKQAKTEQGEEEGTGSKVLKIVNCADVYMRCNPTEGDPDDLGLECEIWMLLDVKNKKLIWADYLGNHMKKRPFEVIPGIELVENRWYGVGVFEMLDHKQLFIDAQFNRVNFKSSKSSSVRFRVKGAVEQWKNGQKLVVGDDQIYDITNPQFSAQNPPLFAVNLTEIDEWAMKLIELMMQAGSTEVGIVGPDDGAMAGLDTTKLATGIKSLERTGNLLLKYTEASQAVAIAAILDQAVDIILERMDENEIRYNADLQSLVHLNRDEIRKMKKKVKLLLTRSRSTETIELATKTVQIIREYYEALTPFERYKTRREYIRQLKALDVPEAAELLDETSKEEAYQWLAQSKLPPVTPPKESIATKYDNLERSEQEQVLKSQGIKPASQAEVTNSDAKEVDQAGKVAKVEAKAKADAAPKPAAKK